LNGTEKVEEIAVKGFERGNGVIRDDVFEGQKKGNTTRCTSSDVPKGVSKAKRDDLWMKIRGSESCPQLQGFYPHRRLICWKMGEKIRPLLFFPPPLLLFPSLSSFCRLLLLYDFLSLLGG